MRYVTAGESHGPSLVTVVTGVPAGVPVSAEAIDADLRRRQAGYGRGGRQHIERDTVSIQSGVRFGATLGTPIAMTIANKDWENWVRVMSPEGHKPEGIRETQPRPGHADLGGVLKIASDDTRDILERASARETAVRVAAGGVAKALLGALGVEVRSFVESVGSISAGPFPNLLAASSEAVEASELRCPDAEATERMKAEIDAARADGESLGGTFFVVASGLVPGLGGYAQAGDRLDARLAAAVMSIPAIKGFEVGDGFASAARRGSEVHDPITYSAQAGIARPCNHAGGLEGGMTNGELLVIRAAMKPIPTLMRPLPSVDLDTLEPVDASKERSDVCAVPAAAVVAEAEVALVLANAVQEKFGADTLTDILAARDTYVARISR
jgi:chorismate synthase